MSINQRRVRNELVDTLKSVACCDQRVGVGELGLVDDVTVTEEGVAKVEVLPCCTYGMARLEHEVEREAGTVTGISAVEVKVAWDEAWDPARMAETADDATPDIEALAEEHDLEPRWLSYEPDEGSGE